MSKTNVEDVKHYFSMLELHRPDAVNFYKIFLDIIPFDSTQSSIDNLDDEILDKVNTILDDRLSTIRGQDTAKDMRFIFEYDWTTKELIWLCLELYKSLKNAPNTKKFTVPEIEEIKKGRKFDIDELNYFKMAVRNNLRGKAVYKGYLDTFGFKRTFGSVMSKFYIIRKRTPKFMD